MKKHLFHFLYLLPFYFVQAQDSIPIVKNISLTQGLSHIVTKDLYRSPYLYKGLGYTASLTFERISSKSIHSVRAGIVLGAVKISFSSPAPVNMLDLEYYYLRKIVENKQFKFYLGGQLDGLSWRVNYFPKMEVPSYAKVHSHLLALSAGIATRLEYRTGSRTAVRLSLHTPLCSYSDRPKFLDGSPRASQFAVLNLWNPKLEVSFKYNVSKKITQTINYQYEYLQYSKPKTIRLLSNGLSIGLKISF